MAQPCFSSQFGVLIRGALTFDAPMSPSSLWPRFQEHFLFCDSVGFSIDISRMRFPDDFFGEMKPRAEQAFEAMRELEAGAIANPDENRMVGHYWLRSPELAPGSELRDEIGATFSDIAAFASAVHSGGIAAPGGAPFTDLLLIGIGGSALGPQFIADALSSVADRMTIHFFDNTDPDGFDKVLERIVRLPTTMVVVISKSGGTKETRNGMLEAETHFASAKVDFAKHAVAVTGPGSELDRHAEKHGWLKRFPMWDWIGGRTSVMSAVGLLPMALQGFDIRQFLKGAAAMDSETRVADAHRNPAMVLALMWFYVGNGRGEKDMVILPYKDRLALFSKYLQQLVMESLGKKEDLSGNVVDQGIAVYGNKGSTDQHAYVQQLRDGVANFFATFIEVRRDRAEDSMEVEPGVTSGDYLHGFLRGTRTALYEGGRDSITISIPDVSAFTVGALIALYERAVGFYASLVNINAYHQPGVEAGKKAATRILELQGKIAALLSESGCAVTAGDLAEKTGADAEDVYHILNHLASNRSNISKASGASPAEDRFSMT
jgi:glucose-6-phosphate isomerase